MDQVKNDEIELSEEIEITEDEVSVAEEEIVDELVVEKSKPKVKEDEEEDDEDEVVDDEPEESAKGKKVKESKKSLKKEFGHDDEEEDDAEEEEESVKAKKSRKESLEIDMSVDVNALLEGEDFSDDFKFKATTIFESAVKSRLVSEIEKMEEEFAGKLDEATAKIEDGLVEKVDDFLNYAVSEWAKDNEVALTHSIQTEMSENFLDGIKELFIENFIDIPEEKFKIVESQFDEIEDLTGQLNVSEKSIMDLTKELNESKKGKILLSLSSDLTVTESEKFKELAENVDFETSELYEKKLTVIKEKYFPTETVVNDLETFNTNSTSTADQSDSMSAYTAAITKFK
jgi:hypothetical protein